jgi:endoglucanase
MVSNVLTIQANSIINAQSQPVVLRGFNLGGWMNMENFITGYPANEEAQRQATRDMLGEETYAYFFDRFLEYFFGRDDAQYIASLGLNLLRLPINYRHFESDMEPFVIKEEGFKHLDRVINLCAEQQIYTIIDLHALPGYQNQDWHSDNPTHKAFFWQHKHFQDRVVHLWGAIATRYKDHPWVAGYNPINEPADPSEAQIEPFYRRLYQAIRAIDPNHILFLEGNRYSLDFHMFKEPLPNVVYTTHDYAQTLLEKSALEQAFLQKTSYMRETGTPIWVGEFGSAQADPKRYPVLRDQLEIYDRYQASWSIWTFKGIGPLGVVSVSPDSRWIQRIQPFLEKKARLGVDAATQDTDIRQIVQPLEETFAREFPNYNPFPFGANWMVRRLVRYILLAEPLLEEYADLFKGMSTSEIDEMMQSFQFKQCVQHTELANILAESPRESSRS